MLSLRPQILEAETVRVPLENVYSLEVSKGRTSYALPGALIGFALGLLVSGAAQTHAHEDEFLGGLSDMEENINRGIVITLGTTVIGAGLGAALGSDDWKRIYDAKGGGQSQRSIPGTYQVAFGTSF